MNNDWNPELYLKFDKERTQPSIDLVSRINFKNPLTIADIGCGPGNSTQILVQRWPDAKIFGIDNSPAMIEKAKKEYPNQAWQIRDAGKDKIEGTFDIVFSNATIQWIPNHTALFQKFHSLLSPKGLVAIQIPLFWDMPLGKAIAGIGTMGRWAAETQGATNLFTIHNYSFYYNVLSELFPSIELWETNYFHILDSQQSILEMIRSTGLKPYLERLKTETDITDFENLAFNEIQKDYPLQTDGKVLFPFKRLFMLAKK